MVFDLIVIVFVLIIAFVGLKKGFMLSILSFAGIFLSLVLAIALVKPITAVLNGTALYGYISDLSLSLLSKVGGFMTTEIPSHETLVTSLSASFPKIIAEALASSLDGLIGTNADKTIAALLTPSLTNVFMGIISFIGIFIVSFIVIIILKQIAHFLTNLPVIGTFDKLLGFVLGLVKGVIIAYLFFLVLSLFSSTEALSKLFVWLNESKLSLYMYNNNLILVIGQKLLESATTLITSAPSPTPAA